MKTNNTYEIRNNPNNGCLTAVLLFIICILFGMMASCKKSECIKPNIPIDKSKICMGCKPKNYVDTTIRKQF